MAGLGAPELLIVLGIIVLLFGGAKLPQLARSLGTAKREFAHGQAEGEPQPPAGPVGPHPPPARFDPPDAA